MNRCLVTGATGQLGRSVVAALRSRGPEGAEVAEEAQAAEVVALAHRDLAVEDAGAVRAALAQHRPTMVFHCGAWTDVDGCERDPERADRVNARGTAHVAAACRESGSGLIYVSTDFVFDGSRRTPYPEDAEPAPLSEYGRSKLGGEIAVLGATIPASTYVVRTSWVFGPGGRNFPRAILQRARNGGPLRVVDDQRGRPTYAPDLALALVDLASSGAPSGIYHAANSGECTWFELAVDILKLADLGRVEVGRTSSAELDRPARRPAYSVLDCTRLAAIRGGELPDYRDAVRRYLIEENSLNEASS